MLPQAQGIMTGQISLDTPIGALLVLLMLVVLASGIVGESLAQAMRKLRIEGHGKVSHRVATAAQRS